MTRSLTTLSVTVTRPKSSLGLDMATYSRIAESAMRQAIRLVEKYRQSTERPHGVHRLAERVAALAARQPFQRRPAAIHDSVLAAPLLRAQQPTPADDAEHRIPRDTELPGDGRGPMLRDPQRRDLIIPLAVALLGFHAGMIRSSWSGYNARNSLALSLNNVVAHPLQSSATSAPFSV